MKVRLLSAIVFGLALSAAATAQDATTGAPTGQSQGQSQRGGRGGWGGGGGMMGAGRGLLGTVTAVSADHYTMKTEAGETYIVHFSANTRILKQGPWRGAGDGGGGGQRGSGRGTEVGVGNPPQPIKPADIKVGDAITVRGDVDAGAKSVGAVAVVQLDPELAKQMREMQANYGKTWLMGEVTAIDGVKVTLLGAIDHTSHTFAADENTTFRKRREPITLADIQVGDTLRVEGAVKDGNFLATTVNAMGTPPGGAPTGPRDAPPQ